MMALLDNFIVKVYELCNINCKYCYMYNLEDSSYHARPLTMTECVRDDLFDNLVNHVSSNNIAEIVIYMHGGEPLMAGKAYIEDWIVTAREKVGSNCKLNISLQTNGLLLDDEWIELFYRHQIRLGISLDGPKKFHDEYRVDKKLRGTFDGVMEKLEVLRQHEFGDDVFGSILSVANPKVSPKEMWDCWISTGFTRFDFNLLHCSHDNPPEYSNDELTDWLIELFDIWWANNDPKYDLRFFRNLLFMTLGSSSSVDYIGGEAIGLVVVETDGSIQGTDALRACKDGLIETGLNVRDDNIQKAMDIELVRSSNHGSSVLCNQCKSCEVVDICGGGYFPHRYHSANGFDNPSVYCSALENIIRHVRGVVSAEIEEVKHVESKQFSQ